MTSKALSILSQDKQGFFLLVEEEGIDEFAHENNGEKVLYSMKQLEAAVAVARRYVTSHPDTLLVITGDHECGGLTVEDNSTADESGDGISSEDGPFPIRGGNQSFTMDWSTSGHTDAPVPISAAGPGSLQLTGQHPNTYVHDVLARALRYRAVTRADGPPPPSYRSAVNRGPRPTRPANPLPSPAHLRPPRHHVL